MIDPTSLITKKLTQEATKEELKQLESWIDENPENKIFYQEFEVIWEASKNYELDFSKVITIH